MLGADILEFKQQTTGQKVFILSFLMMGLIAPLFKIINKFDSPFVHDSNALSKPYCLNGQRLNY